MLVENLEDVNGVASKEIQIRTSAASVLGLIVP